MNRINWFKVTGAAVLLHIILIALSIAEVFIYSTMINTGHDQSFYEAHAVKSAPYVATVAGIILMYVFVTVLARKSQANPFTIGFALPLIYIAIDFIIMITTAPGWTKQLAIILVSNFLKLLAGIIAAYRVKQSQDAA